ncbi:hypothetical protein K6Y76_09735 [Burkholderia cenocepacia]|jgi:hypothetical protein|uniref:hypothetical protein n=5 Tax=Burkholderiaceae TaxID=119060 RepID=UPI00130EC1B6|nr:hypothetical protein [Burkholderia cenocepacia]MCG0580385.1 hypothetical protein [Burkholderia cenocepacia]MCW3522856.1 hypothetical protein [Burkholderia cenocepacia]MCW3613298.1 hypothetical protein [Burkholderia cenocepacia]MCW3666097.1 hypothetical protein [Burkholderia cenocepacia]MCW3680770.1 hypothetical protein [Burkholderia cenocepacia]
MARDADVPGGVRARGPSGLFRYRDAVVVMAAAVVPDARHPACRRRFEHVSGAAGKGERSNFDKDFAEGVRRLAGGVGWGEPCPFAVWTTGKGRRGLAGRRRFDRLPVMPHADGGRLFTAAPPAAIRRHDGDGPLELSRRRAATTLDDAVQAAAG